MYMYIHLYVDVDVDVDADVDVYIYMYMYMYMYMYLYLYMYIYIYLAPSFDAVARHAGRCIDQPCRHGKPLGPQIVKMTAASERGVALLFFVC